jgi:hypothetical protein
MGTSVFNVGPGLPSRSQLPYHFPGGKADLLRAAARYEADHPWITQETV